MEKIKDFFYDKNDLVVALIIIVAAGLLIAWRVEIIMDYPQVMAAQIEEQQHDAYQNDDNYDDGVNGGTDDADGTGTGTDEPNGGADDTQTPPVTTPSGTTGDAAGTNTGANANGSGGANTNTGSGGSGSANPNTGSSGSGGANTNTDKPAAGSNTISVTIPAGSSGEKIAQILVDAGVISSKSDFTTAVSAAGADTKLKAGTFQIPANSSAADVIKIITK